MKLAALILLLFAGCAAQPTTHVTCLSKTLRAGAVKWGPYVQKHVPGAHVIVVHGTSFAGVWFIHPDKGPMIPVELFTQSIRAIEPNTPIVLVCCNEGHYPIKTPNCWYGLQVMWVPPGHYKHGIGCLERMTFNPKGE